MTAAALQTRFCELVGVRYPIVQTGMGWVAGPRLVAATAEAGGHEPAKVFAIMPAKGACGATTIASNFAFQCKRLGKKVLLADMDALTGTLSFMLKVVKR